MDNTENRFKHEGVWYIAVEQDGCCACFGYCDLDVCIELPPCSRESRKDNRSVIFIESDADNQGVEE